MLWGSGFLFVKLALRGLSPIQVVLGQLGLGVLPEVLDKLARVFVSLVGFENQIERVIGELGALGRVLKRLVSLPQNLL